MELRERVELARGKMDELKAQWEAEGVSPRLADEYDWLKTEIQLIQAEAFTRLAYKSW
ncbi:hypothetical protein SEA_LUCKYSOCKE_10 [Streptomyces phage LuckySocke]|jgi:hypothetical protein|nr:hypothetical protein SEA_ALONE_11 [Streptomyces phage Alone3]WPH59028.1 hypothetical protein SEA_LUCKYSOCKE_10 [Streptomyces phage LuckySocke]